MADTSSRVRNLIIGCDGTWNEPEQLDDGNPSPTNVVKFLRAIPRSKWQRVHYEAGVGSGAWEALPGGVYGYGLEQRIQGAYRFLRKRFRDSQWRREQNRIFLIGFSRGAYTVRRLAGLIAHSGIPETSSDSQLGWEIYKERDQRTAEKLKQSGRFFDTPIQMVGVWDTVKATNDADYNDTELSPNVRAGYHAIAIDEKRTFFPVLQWTNEARVLQLWFAGAHSDVGGGYIEAGLSDVALEWMMAMGKNEGLRFKEDYIRESVHPDPRADPHDSFTGVWRAFGTTPRAIRSADLFHPAVGERVAYAPPNLPLQPKYWDGARSAPAGPQDAVVV